MLAICRLCPQWRVQDNYKKRFRLVGPDHSQMSHQPCGRQDITREPMLMQTIALVDDDDDILTSVSIALELEGYKVGTYRDGASALVAFKTSPPDLAILDIKMPRMD